MEMAGFRDIRGASGLSIGLICSSARPAWTCLINLAEIRRQNIQLRPILRNGAAGDDNAFFLQHFDHFLVGQRFGRVFAFENLSDKLIVLHAGVGNAVAGGGLDAGVEGDTHFDWAQDIAGTSRRCMYMTRHNARLPCHARRKIIEMKYFFTAGIQTATGDGVSNTSVKDMIAEIFKGEERPNRCPTRKWSKC